MQIGIEISASYKPESWIRHWWDNILEVTTLTNRHPAITWVCPMTVYIEYACVLYK